MRARFVLVAAVACALASSAWTELAAEDLVSHVDPFVGTAGTGHTFPGPCRPFGLVQPSPETGNASWKYCSGYNHDDTKIRCFAQTHLNGTGQASLGDIAVMPVVADATKRNERASLGCYSVEFAGGVRVEIAAGVRVARYRFTFPKGAPAQIRFDFTHGLYRDAHHTAFLAKTASVERVSNRLIRSFHHSDIWAPRDIASVCRFDRDFASFADGVAIFADGGVIELEIALSTRSVAGAERNLAAEGGVPFERMVEETRAAWRVILKRMDDGAPRSSPPTRNDLTSFATAVYHLCIQPNVISDAGEPVRYSTFSLWDTFRSAHPLYEKLVPERVPDFVNSLLDHFERHGYLPRWELWGRETNCMIGDHAVQVIVDAWQHGFKGFDAERAYRAVRETLTTNKRRWTPGYYPPREERDLWDRYGYFPYDLVKSESVSRTLESAHDDYRAYEFAKGLGRAEDAAFFLKRSWNFTNLFDRATKCFRPKDSKGRFLEPFSSAALSPHFVEGSPLQYMWYVPHRTDWLIAAMGGKEEFEARLDAFFAGTLCPDEPRGTSADVTGLIGDYAHGNEPCHHVVDLYRLVGRDDKADALVRRISREFYRPTPDGLSGNDDCGQMSAWYLSHQPF